MKNFKDMSVKTKLSLAIGVTSFIIMTAICIIMGVMFYKLSLEKATTTAQQSASRSELSLEEYINSVSAMPRAFSAIASEVIRSNQIPVSEKRERLIFDLTNLAKTVGKRIDNFWVMFEPNAVDGMDDRFAGNKDMGSNSKGQFAPWILDGKMNAMEEEDGDEFFVTAKSAMREVFTEPYLYEVHGVKQYLFSLCIPIIVNGKFIGVTGMDFLATDLSKVIEKLENAGNGKLVTNKGIIAVCHDVNEIGKTVEGGNREILDRLSAEKMFDGMFQKSGEETYMVYIPVKFGESAETWFYAVDIPKDEIYAKANRDVSTIVFYCLIGIIAIVITGRYMVKYIMKDISLCIDTASEVANGNLTVSFDRNSLNKKDEFGQLLNAMNNMVTKLRELIGGIINSASNIKEAGENMNFNSQKLSESSNEQASSVEEVSSTMEEITSNINQTADNAQQANVTTNKISDGLNKTLTAAQEVGIQTNAISEKIMIINDIASQTNILALNAAVEAARAGEHGRGFAVVASEVRKLAERSKTAADEIIASAQKTVKSVEESTFYLNGLAPEIKQTIQVVREITTASLEQNEGANQINNAIQQLSQVAQVNASASEDIATNATELAGQAEMLLDMVNIFKT